MKYQTQDTLMKVWVVVVILFGVAIFAATVVAMVWAVRIAVDCTVPHVVKTCNPAGTSCTYGLECAK